MNYSVFNVLLHFASFAVKELEKFELFLFFIFKHEK